MQIPAGQPDPAGAGSGPGVVGSAPAGAGSAPAGGGDGTLEAGGGDGVSAADQTRLSMLVGALEGLRARLAATGFPLDAPGAQAARADRLAALDQLDGYLLPRLRAQAAPLLVVVGGSTGAGKSTLVNSLLGEQVSVPGVLRPTTRAPVLVHHPLDARWFSTDRVLPGLARTSTSTAAAPTARPGAGERGLRLVASEALPRGLALLDAPDVDSVEDANRELASQLFAAADLWLFVTTAARYADAVPWHLLHGAVARRAQVALVVDRVDPGAEAVVGDLRRMMDANGLADAPLFVVPEVELVEGLLDEEAIGPVAAWLSDLGADEVGRRAVATATRDGVVDDLVRRAQVLAAAGDEQVAADERLRSAVARAYDDAIVQVRAVTSDGALLRGEVLARWQELVGTSELFRQVESGIGRLRDRAVAFLRGRPVQEPRVEQAIATGLQAVLIDAADGAAERAHATWRADPAGGPLVAGLDLSRSSPGLRASVDAQVRGWQRDVLDLVREQGEERRGAARYVSLGVNALGISLMVLAFSVTGGVTGVEIGIAGGTAVVAQKLLEAVFGDEAVRRLTVTARDRLDERVRDVLGVEAARYTAQLDALGASSADGDALRAAGREVATAARTERTTRPAAPGEPARRGPALRGARPSGAVAGAADQAAPAEPGFWRRLLRRRGGDVRP